MFVELDELDKGEYFVALNFPYPRDHPVKESPSSGNEHHEHLIDDFNVRVAVYSSIKNIVIDDIPEDDNDVKEFFIDYIRSDAKKCEQSKYYFDEEGEKEAFRVPYFDQKSAYGYIYYENNSDGFINENITFYELLNVSIMPLLRKGELSSLKTAVDNTEEPKESEQFNQLQRRIDVNSKFTILEDIKPKKPVSQKQPLKVQVSIAPRSCGTILLEKSQEEARVDLDSNIIITYPIHTILSNPSKFPPTMTKVKYNNNFVDIYETIIEHNSGVLIRYRNKTKKLVFGSHIEFKELRNLKMTLNTDELKQEALDEQLRDAKEELVDDGVVNYSDLEPIDINNFKFKVKDPSKEVFLILEPGEVKFVQLEAVNIFENFEYSLDSKFTVNVHKK